MTAVLVDLSGWARAAFETIPPAWVGDEPVAVTRNVVGRLVRLLVDDAPTHLAFCADSPGPYWQSELWIGYKAGRAAPGPEYDVQHERIIEILRLHRIPVYRAAGFQADDCFAAAIKAIGSNGCAFCNGEPEPCACNAGRPIGDVCMITKDHDLWQLVGPISSHREVYASDGKGIVRAKEVHKKYGVVPGQLADLLALTGDGDEAPGIEGIGPKNAARLLTKHGSLDEVLRKWSWEKTAKARERLRDGADSARLSRELVGLRSDAPIGFDAGELRVGWDEADAERIRLVGFELGIDSMLGVKAMPKRNR